MSDGLLPGSEDRFREADDYLSSTFGPKKKGAQPDDATPESYLTSQFGRPAKDVARVVTRAAVPENPDVVGAARRAAETLSVPPGATKIDPELAKIQARVAQIDQALEMAPPKVAKAFRHVAEVGHDEAEKLALMGSMVASDGSVKEVITGEEYSRRVREVKKKNPALDWDAAREVAAQNVHIDSTRTGLVPPKPTLENLAKGVSVGLVEHYRQVFQGLNLAAGDVTKDSAQTRGALQQGRDSFRIQQLETPRTEGFGGAVYGGVQSTVQSLVPVAAGMLGGLPTSLAAMFVEAAAPAYLKYRARGGAPGEAGLGAVIEGAAEAYFEKAGMGFLLKNLGRLGFGAFVTGLLKGQGREVINENLTTLVQTATDTAIANPNKTWGDWLKEVPGAAFDTTVGTLTQGVILGLGNKAVQMSVGPILQARDRAQQAELRAQYLDSLNAAVGATKVLQRDANSLQAFLQEAATDGPVENLYVPAAVFAQAAGENLELLKQQVPAVAEQIDTALATGGDLVIPVGKLVALQGTGMEKVLIDNARTTDDPGDMSREDAKVFLQQEGKRFEEAAAKMVEKATEDAAQTASRQAVEADLMKQFAGVERFSQEVAAFNSKLAGAMFETMGRKLGKTAEQVYREFALRLQSAPIDKASFDQDPTSTPQFKEWFKKSVVADAEGTPLRAFHSTIKSFDAFDTLGSELGSHFGNRAQAAAFGRDKTLEVYLSIQNPLRLVDTGGFAPQDVAPQLVEKGILTEEEAAGVVARIEGAGVEEQAAVERELNAYLQRAIEKAGYDGVVYLNRREGIDYSGVDESEDGFTVDEIAQMSDGEVLSFFPDAGDSYIAFHPEQIKSATGNTGAFDPNNPNIFEQRAPKELPAGKPIPDTVAAAGTLRAVLPLAGERHWKTNREFKLAIQERVRAAADAAGVDLDNDSVELREFLYKVLLDESRSAIEGDSTAIGWYDEKVTVAIEVLSVIHPELKTDPIAKFHFTLALAITSNGIKVDRNFVMAEVAYEQKKRTGSFPYNKGEGTAAVQINKAFRYVDRLLAEFKDQQLEELFTSEKTVREWERIFGKKVSGEGMDETAFGAAVMGPKIGNGFFMNLHGRFGQLTMDRWFVRLWKRLTGGLVVIDQDRIKKNRNGLEAIIRALQLPENKEAREALEKELNSEKQTKLRITLKDRDLLAQRVLVKTSKGARRDRITAVGALSPEAEEALSKIVPRKGAEKSYGTLGNALRLLSKSYIKAVDGQVEGPTQPERPMMRAVMRRVLAELQKTWEHLTMADLQAVLWYPEKRLYEKAGVDEAKEKAEQAEADEEDYSEDEAPDYANAAVKLAQLKGIKDEDINAAVAEGRRLVSERNRARATRAVDGVGSGAPTEWHSLDPWAIIPAQLAADVRRALALAPPAAEVAQITQEQRAQAEALLKPLQDRAQELWAPFKAALEKVAFTVDGHAKVPPVKGLARAATKLWSDYNHPEKGLEPQRMQDMLRATIVVRSPADFAAAFSALSQEFEITRVKNRSLWDVPGAPAAGPLPTGYSDMLLNVRVGELVAEVQINVPAMLALKDVGHKLYNVEREMSDGPRKDALIALQKQVYGLAESSPNRLFDSLANASGVSGMPSRAALPVDPQGRAPSAENATADRLSGDSATASSSTSSNDQPAAASSFQSIGTSAAILPQTRTLKQSGVPTLADPVNPIAPAGPEVFTKEGIGSLLRRGDWAILTAENPEGVQLPEAENAVRLDAMRQQLTQMGLQFVDVLGSYGGNPEPSIAITGITEDQALALARQFGQQSVLTRKGLVYRDGTINPSKGLTVHAAAPADFYTVLPDGTTFTVGIDFEHRFPAQEDRVGVLTVGAVHFSEEVRTALDPTKYGSGMKGAEKPAPGARARTHWYVNNGQGVTPESGVGAFAHVARLTNLYDADADPLGIWSRGEEYLLYYAGFSGYVTRNFNGQAVAVLLGKTPVSVTYVGGALQANEMLASEKLPGPQYTAKRALADEIMSDTRVPLGQIERARWKGILEAIDPRYVEALPASAFEGDERVYRDELVRALFNQGKGVTRGQIGFGDDITKQPSVIALLKDANLSTFHHELAHFYFEMLIYIARQPGAPQSVVDDLNILFKWLGVRDLVEWDSLTPAQQEAHHEQVARGYEAYLFEGKAPSTELRGVMATVRGWMINIYKQITNLGVALTDEVRGVYDRMLASEEQIKAASEEQALMPFFKSAEEMGATPEEWLQYQRLAADAQEDALRSFEARSLRDMQWLTNARGRLLRKMQREVAEKRAVIEEEVTKEVEQQPVYAARKWLAYGILPTGEQTVGAKLDIDAMREMYGDSPAAIWRYLPTGEKGLAGKEGMHPDQVAEMFGFSSGDALVRALVAADKQQDVIEGLTDQRMLERYGDLQSPAGVERAVNEALHSELRAKMIATELAALQASQPREDTGRTTTDAKGRTRKITLAVLPRAARAFAERLLAQKRINDIKPNRYIAAEVRAARAAESASKVEEKIIEKRNQLINHYAAKLGFEALDEVEKSLRYLRKFEEEGTRKNLASDYVDQIDQLLEKVELRRVSEGELRKRASLNEWMQRQEALGLDPVIDQALVDAAGMTNYRTMTLEEFRGLVDSVKSIEHLGRLKQKLLTAKDEREFAAVVEEMRASAEANANREAKVRIEQGRGLDRGLKMGRQVTAMHRKFASLIREIDGGKDGGAWWERLVRPMNASGDKEVAMRADATMAFAALAKQHLKDTKLTRKEEVLPGISLSREGMISMALNWGNEGNRQRLLDGGFTGTPITQAQAEAVLARLTDAEWNFVEAVWKMLDQYRPQIAEQEKRLTGVEPKWVEPTPFTLPGGRTIAGGYYPAKYDVDLSTRSNELEAITDLRQQMRGAAGRASTRKGYTEQRAAEVKNRPLRKDFGVIVQHLSEVTHRLAWQDWIVDARRLIGAKALDGIIREKYGPEILTELRKQVEDLAAGDVGATTAFEGVMAHLRKGVSIAGMGWNLMTALIQPFGYTQSMVRIGTKWAAVGLGKFVANPVVAWQEAKAKSSFMETRALTINRDLTDILNRIDSKELSNLEASYFWLIQKMQMAVDVPTWHGAYERALVEGNDEKRAIALADQAVIDAQGAGHLKDQARIQRGSEAAKLFTSFYNFFNTTYNNAIERGRTAGVRGERAKLLSDYALLFVIPVMGSVLLKALLKGEDDDPEKLLKKYAAEQISYLLGTSLITREMGGAISGAIGGFPYSGPASMRVFVETGKLAVQAGQGEVDKAALKAANNVGGILLHYPAGQVQRTVEGLYEMNQGPQPITAPIFGPVRN